MPVSTSLVFQNAAAFSHSFGALASSSSGVGEQTALISNTNNYPAAWIYAQIKSGSNAPTAGAFYYLYLLRRNATGPTTYATDGAATSAGALTRRTARELGRIQVTATADFVFSDDWDTSRLGALGPQFGLLLVNASGQALASSDADIVIEYAFYQPQTT